MRALLALRNRHRPTQRPSEPLRPLRDGAGRTPLIPGVRLEPASRRRGTRQHVLVARLQRRPQQFSRCDVGAFGQDRAVGIKRGGMGDAAGEPAENQQLKRLSLVGLLSWIGRQGAAQPQHAIGMIAAQLLKTGQQTHHGFTRLDLGIRRKHGTCPQNSPATRPC
ncbi:MAG: hypothetical protein ACK56F_22810, partial [bacterium]